jgi:hypothetical protein
MLEEEYNKKISEEMNTMMKEYTETFGRTVSMNNFINNCLLLQPKQARV